MDWSEIITKANKLTIRSKVESTNMLKESTWRVKNEYSLGRYDVKYLGIFTRLLNKYTSNNYQLALHKYPLHYQ